MPSLVYGQPISAEEIERIVSREFSPEMFVRLCNSIAWASTGKECSSLPFFTERIYVPDGGRDAEWTVEIAPSKKQVSAFLSSGWNVYQYKHRDVSARNRTEIVSKLKADLKGALKDVIDRHKRKLSRYVLFVNLHLTLDEQNTLKANIQHNCGENESTTVEIVEAAFLASSLNNLPHLRSSFFSTSQFITWQQAWLEHENRKIYGANISLTGRDEKLNVLRTLIDNPEVRAVIISGAKDIGKTRLVLEATRHRAVETVVSVNRSIEASDLRYLESSSSDVVILIEDPNPNKIKELINQILSLSSLKLIITVPISENSPTINFGLDERIETVQLSPLREEESRELLRTAEPELDHAVKSWIVKQAGGNPGILLLAAKQGTALRKGYGSFLDQIAKALEQEVQEQVGITALEVLKLLSLLEYVGIEGRAFVEVKTLCKWFRPNLQLNEVNGVIQNLIELGFLQSRGIYAEVTPPLFANHLSASMLKGRRSEFLALFADLNQEERSRLIRRLQGLNSEKIAWFWNEIFSPNGLLRDLPTAISNREILYLAACANPSRTIRLIEQIKTTNLEERKYLQYSERSTLIWALEELIFHEGTSLHALWCLGLIAEIEPTNANNNSATGKFCQCFRPFHSQVPLPFQYRLDLLKQFSLSNQSTVELRLLAIQVIKTTLDRWGYHFLREVRGNKPSDSMPQMTWGDVWNYQENLLQLLIELAQSDQSQVAEAARQSLPQAIEEFSMLQFSPKITTSAFQKAIDWVINEQISLPVSKLADALNSVYSFYQEEKKKFGSDAEIEVEKLLESLNALRESLNKCEFAIRMKRWAGHCTSSHIEYELDEYGNHVYRDEQEAQILAQEVINNPSLLTKELLDWLCSAEAQEAHKFCFQLGRLDIDRRWITQIEQIGIRQDGIKIFSAYCGGLSQINRQFVSEYLDEVTKQGEVRAEAIVYATQKLGGDLQGVNCMVRLIRDERVDPKFVEYVLEWGRWLAPLNSDEYLCLLEAIAGPDLINAAAVVKSLWMWLHLEKTIEGRLADFAWHCLEVSNGEHQDYHCFDQLALYLVRDDVGRGFELLEKLLLRQLTEYQCWNPISSNDQREFWHFLYSHDRKLSIEIPLKIAVEDSRQHSLISWHLQRIINQEENLDVLTEFAKSSETQAKVVCDILSSKSSAFWQIAFEIITQYSDSQDIKNALSYLVVEPNPMRSRLEYLRNGLNVVEQALNEKHPSFPARLWLDELRLDLQIKIEEEQSSQEVDLLITSTSMQFSKPVDSERIWAIRRLLNDGDTERIRQLLSQNELLEIIALPDLSETERQQILHLFEPGDIHLSTPTSTSASVNISSVEKLILMSNQSPIFNQQHAIIGVNYAAEGSKQEFTQNITATEQNFEVLLTDFEQFINDLQQKYPNATDEAAIQIIDVEAQKQPIRFQNFLNLKRLWNGGKKAAVKVGEHFTEQNPWGKGAIAFLEGVMEEPK